MRRTIELKRDLPRLTPCAARLVELLVDKIPYLSYEAKLRIDAGSGSKSELDLYALSPSKQMVLEIGTTSEGVEVRLLEKGKSGVASAFFFMHPLNFHRTAEAAVEFVEKIAHGQIIVAREKKRVIPFIGPKRLRFYEVGEIVGTRANEVEKVFAWQGLNL